MSAEHPPRIFRTDFWIDISEFKGAKFELLRAISDVAAHTFGTCVVDEVHAFADEGLLYSALLLESHINFHSWPEEGVAWAEVATCGTPETLRSFRHLMTDRIGGEVEAPRALPPKDSPGVH